MSIKVKLTLCLGVLVLALSALAASGLFALNLTSQRTSVIVADGVAGLGDLTRINDMYSNIVRDTQGVVLGELSFADGKASAVESLAQIAADWASYQASNFGPEAAKLVSTANERMVAAQPAVDKLQALLDAGDLPGLAEFTKTELGEVMESIASQFDQLAEIQIGVADADNVEAQSFASLANWALIAIAAASAMILGYVGFVLLGGVVGPLQRMETAMRSIAAGGDVAIPSIGRKDEIGKMADAVQVFRDAGRQVKSLTDAELLATARGNAERSAMMAQLRTDFGGVVDAAILGDFSKRVTASFADEALNSLAAGVNNLVSTVDRGVSSAGAVLNALASFDLRLRVEGEFFGAFKQLKDDTNAVAERLTHIVGTLQETSGALRMATGEILSGANDLSDRTTRQAATIEQTSAAVEQLSSTVMQSAAKAETAVNKADAVRVMAEQSGAVMEETTEAMARITQSSAKISNIIGLIDDIAFQTNLLALNASVEAARAGDAGKGFAVVAVEVRRLAQSAAQASSEVKALIEQSAVEVSGGSRLASDAASKLALVLDGIRQSAASLTEIARDSRAQAGAIAEVSTAVRTMDEMTQHNASLVQETNAAIEQTERQAKDLDKVVASFTLANSAGLSRRLAA
ncbi:methyl-accepting chemotaxis protein [Devosia sp.]|uniref:methyl-accepting chemotaxis protein n=1 Tax=Devosia sp. TaxID=1871048 RepID=UPI003BAAC0C6